MVIYYSVNKAIKGVVTILLVYLKLTYLIFGYLFFLKISNMGEAFFQSMFLFVSGIFLDLPFLFSEVKIRNSRKLRYLAYILSLSAFIYFTISGLGLLGIIEAGIFNPNGTTSIYFKGCENSLVISKEWIDVMPIFLALFLVAFLLYLGPSLDRLLTWISIQIDNYMRDRARRFNKLILDKLRQ